MPEPLVIDGDTWVLVLTGAGVSAESGIPTFRGAGGLWEQHRLEQLATAEAFARDPGLVWRFYSYRREKAALAEPNPSHRALVALERRLEDRFLLATQNVDDLHRRAGSQRMVELHGNLFRTRCSDCLREPFEDRRSYGADSLPRCHCGALLRPHIVWFGEMLDPSHLERVGDFMRQASSHRFIFVAAGTSGAVWPAAGFVEQARALGADTWLVNADPAENTARFHHFVQGKSGEVLPMLFG